MNCIPAFPEGRLHFISSGQLDNLPRQGVRGRAGIPSGETFTHSQDAEVVVSKIGTCSSLPLASLDLSSFLDQLPAFSHCPFLVGRQSVQLLSDWAHAQFLQHPLPLHRQPTGMILG